MFSKFFKKNKNYLDTKSKRDLLHNIYVLYIVFVIAIADIFYLLQLKDFNSAFVFISVGIITSFFSKNMVVILLFAIVAAHILKYGSKWKEGFEDSSEQTDIETTDINESETVDSPDSDETVESLDSDETVESPDTTLLDTENRKTTNKKTKKITKTKNNKNVENIENIENIENTENTEKTKNPEQILKILEKQSSLLDRIDKYKPLLNSITSISKNLGLSTTAPP